MGVGGFKQPDPGPRMGGAPVVSETLDYKDLPPERKAELGDLEALAKASATPEPNFENPEDAKKVDEGAERLAATQAVLARETEPEEEPDPAEARLEEAAQPTIEDRQAFLRSVLGNTCYEKRYELFGGMMVLTLSDVAPEVEDRLFAELSTQVSQGLIKTDDDWQQALDQARLVTNVIGIRKSGSTEELHRKASAPIMEHVNDVVAMFPSAALYRAALQTVRVFARHMELMLDRALDSDFWEVGGLDSLSEPTVEEPSDME